MSCPRVIQHGHSVFFSQGTYNRREEHSESEVDALVSGVPSDPAIEASVRVVESLKAEARTAVLCCSSRQQVLGQLYAETHDG